MHAAVKTPHVRFGARSSADRAERGHSRHVTRLRATSPLAAALAGALALASVVAIPAAAQAAAPLNVLSDPITLDSGHIDAFNLVLAEDDSPLLTLKEDVTGSHVLRTPESVEMHVKAAAHRTTSAPAFPTNLPVPFYLLPQTQNQNLIWPGWDTNSLVPVYGPSTNTGIVVSSVDGPGSIWLWQLDGDGITQSVLDGGGFSLPGTIRQAYPSHTHTAWGFTNPGTYKLTVHAEVQGNGQTVHSAPAEYTFVVAERSKLTPQAPTQNGNTVTVPSQAYVSYTDANGAPLTAGDHELTGPLTVHAKLAAGFDLADGASTQWTFTPPSAQSVTIGGLHGHYHQNSQIVLTATADPAVTGGSYAWFIQRKDQTTPVQVAGQQTGTLQVTAEQALDDAKVTVQLLDADQNVLVTSAEAVIQVDDHGAAPLQTVTIAGLAEHYHSGTVANLTASVTPASVLTRYEWQVQKVGETSWTSVPNQHGPAHSFTVTNDLHNAKVRARLTFNDGTLYVQSAPVTVVVDDHDSNDPVTTTLSITGLQASYQAGAVATLTAVQTPATNENHYHWFIKRSGEIAYTEIPGATVAQLQYSVLAEDANAQLMVRLYDQNHGLIAESAAVVLTVQQPAPSGTPKPSTAPSVPDVSELDSTPAGGINLDRETVQQGGIVNVQVGAATEYAGEWVAAWMFSTPALLGGDWQQVAANGKLSVRVPADATPGTHRLAVFSARGSLIGWQTFRVIRSSGTAPVGADRPGELSRTGSNAEPFAAAGIAAAMLFISAGASMLLVHRRRNSLRRDHLRS